MNYRLKLFKNVSHVPDQNKSLRGRTLKPSIKNKNCFMTQNQSPMKCKSNNNKENLDLILNSVESINFSYSPSSIKKAPQPKKQKQIMSKKCLQIMNIYKNKNIKMKIR
ncbi:hypothetical protein pb186bvf_018723 [Paramecium bursaria]